MAKVVEWASGNVPPSELRFLEKAVDLPADWTVVHGLRVRRGRADREVDFLVIDPARGLLAIEVKGGRVGRIGPDWFSIDRHGERHPIRNPADQVHVAGHVMTRWLRETGEFRRKRPPRIHGAVALPDVQRTVGDLGPDLDVKTVLFADDLKNLKGSLDKVFEHYLEAGGIRMSAGDIRALLRAIEPLEFTLGGELGARVARQLETIDRLTHEQAERLEMLENHRRAAIEGAAGTGKTVLAQIRAAQLAESAQRVLLLCYNRALARELLAPRARENGYEAKHFHGLCADRAQRAGLPWNPPKGEPEEARFWEHSAADLLVQALEARPEDRFDAIIVDEGQDFQPDWWVAIQLMMRDDDEAILFAFFDPNQDIHDGGRPRSLSESPSPLKRNCRNTRRIAKHAADVIGMDSEVMAGTPQGAKVETLSYESAEEMADHVRRQLHRLVAVEKIAANQITVLSTRRASNSSLARSRHLGNFRLVDPASDPGASMTPADVRFTSLHAFKGLESDVVILVDVDGSRNRCSPKHLYVAATRAKTLLIILEKAGAAA